MISERRWLIWTRGQSITLRVCALFAISLLLAGCNGNEPVPNPDSEPVTQTAQFAAPATAQAIASAPVAPKIPTRSPGAAEAARQRAEFLDQEQLRAVEAERAAEIRRQRDAQERHERILNEIARRAAQRRAAIAEEQYRQEARREIVNAACEQARIAEIAADYRGERPSGSTRSLLAACDLPSAGDRWEQVVAIWPAARSDWEALAEAESASWAEAERREAELRRAEAVRERKAEIEAQILADQLAFESLQQDQPADIGWWEKVTSALPAPLIQLVQQSVAKLNAVPAEIGLRAAYVNQRAQSGAVTGLALAEKMPLGVRAAGEDAMTKFSRSRHVSHIKSVSNNPALAAASRNLIWEKSKWNLARGARNISTVELLRANAHNGGAALKVAGPGILAHTAQGCVIGAVMELPATAAEQRRDVLDGAKTTEEAALDAAKSVAATGLAGCVLTAAAAGAASAGVLSLSAPILIPIVAVGGTVYVLTTSKRIWVSLSEEEQAAVLGQLDVSREVVRSLTGSTWAAAQDGGAVVATAIQETANEAGWWVQSEQPEPDSPVGN